MASPALMTTGVKLSMTCSQSAVEVPSSSHLEGLVEQYRHDGHSESEINVQALVSHLILVNEPAAFGVILLRVMLMIMFMSYCKLWFLVQSYLTPSCGGYEAWHHNMDFLLNTASFSEKEVTFEPDATSEPDTSSESEEVGPSGACSDWKRDFKSCGSACPPSCQDPSGSRPCTRQCIAGCFCRYPYVLSDGDSRDSSCIAQNQCPHVEPFWGGVPRV